MLRKYGLGFLALLMAMVAVSFTTIKNASHSPKTSFFYRFDGNVGEENIMSKWTSVPTYGSVSCSIGTLRGCKIENTTNSAGHPTSVPLDPATHLPVVSNPTQPQAENRSN